jgi:hypothetical protein
MCISPSFDVDKALPITPLTSPSREHDISGNSFYTALTVLLSWTYWMYLKRHMQLQGVPQPSPPPGQLVGGGGVAQPSRTPGTTMGSTTTTSGLRQVLEASDLS